MAEKKLSKRAKELLGKIEDPEFICFTNQADLEKGEPPITTWGNVGGLHGGAISGLILEKTSNHTFELKLTNYHGQLGSYIQLPANIIPDLIDKLTAIQHIQINNQ